MPRRLFTTAAAMFLLLPGAGFAATYTDNAGNYSGTYAGQNGGAGFGAFSVNAVNGQPPYSGTFLSSAAASEGGNGTPAPSALDTGGQSFGFYANGGNTASVTIDRSFNTALQNAGDAFSLDFLTGYNDAGTAGVSLLSGGGPLGAFNYVSGGTGYEFNGTPIGQGYQSGILHLLWTVTSPTTYSFAASGPISYNGTGGFSGPITGFEIMGTNSGAGTPDHDGFFNNLSVTNTPQTPPATVPEAGDGLLLLAGGIVLSVRLMRRRRHIVSDTGS